MTLQVEATEVVDGLGKERGIRGDSYVFGLGGLVLVTDWVEMKS